MAATQPDLDAAYDLCRRITKAEAKNFYYAFRTLPAVKRRAIYAAYAFCRLCDDISDEEMSHARSALKGFRGVRESLVQARQGPVRRACLCGAWAMLPTASESPGSTSTRS